MLSIEVDVMPQQRRRRGRKASGAERAVSVAIDLHRHLASITHFEFNKVAKKSRNDSSGEIVTTVIGLS